MRLPIRFRAFESHSDAGDPVADGVLERPGRLRTDGGEGPDDQEENGTDEEATVDRSNVELTEQGEAEPAEPTWERPAPEDIPDFEIRADRPLAGGGDTGDATPEDRTGDPTAGMPNAARSPGQARIDEGGTEGYIVALELCARLPDDVRLPEDAADLVPAAVEAELEEDIQAFAAAEFDNPTPSVDTLAFVEADDEVWMRLRLGVPSEAFVDLDPDEVRAHALQQLEGLF